MIFQVSDKVGILGVALHGVRPGYISRGDTLGMSMREVPRTENSKITFYRIQAIPCIQSSTLHLKINVL